MAPTNVGLTLLALAAPLAPAQACEEREVRVAHADGASFGGTLTLPTGPGPHPTALLVSPGGEHPRDELRSGGEHWVHLAADLARAGVASLRVDNRGIGASSSTERPAWSWDWTTEDLAADLEGHLAWLADRPELDPNRIGLVAHGDATLQAARVAAEDRGLAFAILLSAPAFPAARRLARMQASALPEEDRDEVESALAEALLVLAERGAVPAAVDALGVALEASGVETEAATAQAAALAERFDGAFQRDWLGTDPAPIVGRVELPLLVLYGSGDERLDARGNAGALGQALARSFNAKVDVEEGLGHFLEGAEELRLDPRVHRRILDWIGDAAGLCREDALPAGRPGPAPALWIRAVQVVDVRGGDLTGPFDVRLAAGRIAALEPPRAGAPGPGEVDGRGRFLIPGLWDAHTHLTFWGGDALARLAAGGVTSVRDMGGDADQLLRWRGATAEGGLLGPRIFLAGPFVDGPKPNFQWREMIATYDEGASVVQGLAQRGVDLVKVHSFLPRPALRGAASAAREAGLPLAGHPPVGVSPLEAAELGFASIEHASSLLRGLAEAQGSPAPSWPAAYRWWCSEPGTDAMARLAELGTRVTPTLVTGEVLLVERGSPYAGLQPWCVDLTGRLHRSGVVLLAGTDLARRLNGIEPGAALRREVGLLAQAGLEPWQALRAATLEPALSMGRTDLGVVEVGALADLVLLKADPLADPAALDEIEGVCLDGHWYDAEALAALEARARRAADLNPAPIDHR